MVVLVMNKLFIPAILTATVLAAGIFAFMPIEKASTVHTTILGKIISAQTINLAGTKLPTNNARVLFDLAGLGGSAKVEVNGALSQTGSTPGSVKVQVLSGGTWNDLFSDSSAGNFPIDAKGDVHADASGVNAVRIANTGNATAAFSDGAMISITINGVS